MQGRCAPAWTLPFGCALALPLALCPWLGGTEEVSGVLDGSLSLSRSVAFSPSNAATRTANSSTRASSVAISASFSAADNGGTSGTKRIKP